MFIKLLVPLLCILPLHAMQQENHMHETHIMHAKTTKLDPKSTIIAFDIDEVIITGREAGYEKWLKEQPQFSNYIEAVKKNYKLTDAHTIINKVAEEHPELKSLAEEFKKVIITAPQITGTIEIIHQLVKNGYTVVTASNMTTSTYQSLVDEKVLPAEFNKEFFFVQTHPFNQKSDGSYYKKPAKEYYQNLIKYVECEYPCRFKNRIFTDDKLENAQAAAAAGTINAIHFINPNQCKEELKKLGVAIE